ncbi:ammonium transporter [Lignipirellula cremea]|uniref:Sensory/regulatory protein RpfC n=1 Tax=Lignipirellula cremea TaxID=2528010 RepID=A0A518DTE2_9BACT|nr:ammonium transporter [Lignipirellula cremea]QDU95112.1 Signal transduction histidine-protein kinase BarA [Lignipirellula cremea]
MSSEKELADILWMLLAAAMVMLMQGGFCFLECGVARAKNSINVAIKNLVDFCLAAAVFWLFGFALMFGESYHGFWGLSHMVLDKSTAPWLLAFFLFQLVFCGTATTIISGAVAERIRFRGYLIVSLLVSGIVYPVFGHWAWNGAMTQTAEGWLNKQGFIDFAGSTVVHSVGGWVALAAVLIIGPRIGRFGAKGKEIPGHNLPMATFGVLILWFGWFGFNGGSTLALNENIPLILVNTNLAAACGGLASLLCAVVVERRPVVSHVINGVVAGLVSITASCHIMEPAAAMLIGAIGGCVCSGATWLLPRLKIDDVIGAVPAHAVAGAWGTIAVALLASPEDWGTGLNRWEQLAIQAQGVGVCFAWSFGGGFAVLWTINRFLPLRATEEHELTGLNVSEHGASTELIDLLAQMTDHRHKGNFHRPVEVEPHTEVGQIATEYNLVLERVNAEMASREAAEIKFRGIFENAVEGIYQTTPEGQVISANPALVRLCGYDSLEALCQGIADTNRQLYVDPDRRRQFVELLEHNDVMTGFESQIYLADRSVIWVSENARAHRNGAGELLYYEGTVEDISQRKENQRLNEEKKTAEAKNVAKSQFLASMSHEIRTPLNGVIGMLDLLSRTRLDSTQRRYADIAASSADSLLSLINDILDFSKIEAGKLELECIDFNLHELIEDLGEMFVHRATERGIELTCHVMRNVPVFIKGDPERLKQVLTNLLSNAIKFTDEGEVALQASVESPPSGGRQRIRFAVRDSGIGIPADRVGQLFQSFSQVDTSTTRRFGGTGLGLAICRQMMQLMNGEIHVDSQLGSGSTFTCSAPFEVVIGRSEKTPAVPERLQSMRVLVVDDNPTNLEILQDQLSHWGVTVTTARSLASGRAAFLESQTGKPYDIALLDRAIGDADGFDLAREIRESNPSTATRVIMLSSFDDSLGDEIARELGVGYLRKPVRQSRLLDAMAASIEPTSPFGDAADALSEATSPAVAVLTPLQEPGPAPVHGRVLIVDDNAINQMVAEEMVQTLGYQTDIASNGGQAIELVKRRRYDLVLMDCQMPLMDGFEATREIRQYESIHGGRGPDAAPLSIIALTANAVQGDRERCLTAGMNDYLTKPLNRQALIAAFGQHQLDLPATLQIEPPGEPAPSEESTTILPTGETIPSSTKAQGENSSTGSSTQVATCLPPIALEELRERCGHDQELIHRIFCRFRDRARQDLATLSEVALQGDAVAVERQSHMLKGVAGNISAPGLLQSIRQLETTAAQISPAQTRDCLSHIEQQLDRVLEQIDAVLEDFPSEISEATE